MDFLFQRTHWKQFIVFLFGGGLGALLNLGITYFLTEFFGFWYLTAYSFGVVSNIIFNFFFHRSITFQEKGNFKKRMARFFLTSVFIGSGIMLLVYVFTDVLRIRYLLSGILAIGIMSTINFFINKFWVFSQYAED